MSTFYQETVESPDEEQIARKIATNLNVTMDAMLDALDTNQERVKIGDNMKVTFDVSKNLDTGRYQIRAWEEPITDRDEFEVEFNDSDK